MTPSRAARLSSIGFAWQTSDPRHVPWETRFEQLLEYKAEHGTLNDSVVSLYFVVPTDPTVLFVDHCCFSCRIKIGDCVVPIGWRVCE